MTQTDAVRLEQLLDVLADQGFARADSCLLREIAETLWYGHKVPDLSLLPAQSRPIAGYVVDRLIRFNVVPKAHKQRVLSALSPYKPAEPSQNESGRDALAVCWGAPEDLTPRLPELMPFQTRQYALEKSNASK